MLVQHQSLSISYIQNLKVILLQSFCFLIFCCIGLFWGVILESGSFLSPWAYQRRSREYAFTTAGLLDEEVGNSNDSQNLLKFLRSVSAEDLDKASYTLSLTVNSRYLKKYIFFVIV